MVESRISGSKDLGAPVHRLALHTSGALCLAYEKRWRSGISRGTLNWTWKPLQNHMQLPRHYWVRD